MIVNRGAVHLTRNIAVALVIVFSLGGCLGGDKAEVPKLAPVQGTITLDGEPEEGVTVTFLPVSGTAGTGGTGTTDASGKYTLMHRSGNEGAEPGTYTVIFSKFRLPDGSPIPEGASSADTGAREFLPARYTDPSSSPEKATIPEGGATLDFQLSS